MKRSLLIILIIMILLTSCFLKLVAQPGEDIVIGFPLSKGSYWVYEGLTKWTRTDSQKVIEKVLQWKMEVIETINRGHITAAVLKGHPLDLAWYEDGKDRGDYLIIRVGSGKFYLLRDQWSKEVLKRLRDEGDMLQGLVQEWELFLDLPLTSGKVFGEVEQITRQDGSYCWFVEGKKQIKLKDVKGISSMDKMAIYQLIFRTLPDHQSVEFVPGIGITRYVYRHHGTVSETELKLIECRLGDE